LKLSFGTLSSALPIILIAGAFITCTADFSSARQTSSVEEVTSLSPEDLLTLAIESCQKLDAYQCRLTLHLTKGDQTQDSQYVFSYKKPNLIRMHVEGGKDRGSTVIFRRDGCIRGRREGLLSFFAVTLKPDDHRLYDLWGRSFVNSDWVTLLAETKDRAKDASATEVKIMDGGKRILIEAQGDGFVEQTLLDAGRMVLLEKRSQRDNGDRLQAVWSDISLNPILQDGFFYF
jgi:hypothetical protein